MMNLLQWHDRQFLRFVQEYYFGTALISGTIVVLLLVALPLHRRLSRIVLAATTGWVLLTIGLYGGLTEAPALTCATLFAAVYGWTCCVAWQIRAPRTAKPSPARWASVRPRGTWVAGLVRDYFRVDPRGVYWLDSARASRGVTPRRSLRERKAALIDAVEIPHWRARLWREVVFPLAEMHLRVCTHLPSFWHYDRDFEQRDRHVQAILRDEIARALRFTAVHEAGRSFDEYRLRTVDAALNERALKLAASFSRKACLLMEAWIESRLFNDDRQPGDQKLCSVADSLIELWRLRRRHQHLWAADVSNGHPTSPDGATEPVTEIIQQHANESDGNGREESYEENSNEADDSTEAVVDLELRLESAVDELPLETNPEGSQFLETETDEVIESTEPAEIGTTAHSVPGQRRWRWLRWAFHRSSSNGDENASDEFLTPQIADEPSPADWDDSTRDLRLACNLLEAFLDFQPCDNLADTAQAARRLFDRPASWPAATRLLMLYCLRSDLCGDRDERAKTGIVAWLLQWARGLQGKDDLIKSVRHVFFELLIDWHSLRGGYTQIRELFSQNEPRTSRQWELLGLADAQIARQVKDRPSLRDSLVRDAAASLFRARVSGFWTQRYAGVLLATDSCLETVRLLQDHDVEFGRSALDRMIDQSSPVSRPQLQPSAAVTFEIDSDPEPVSDERPAWLGTGRKSTPPSSATAKPPASRKGVATETTPATERAASPQPTLTLVDLTTGRRLTCKKYPLKFGTDSECQVHHARLERRHCAMVCDGTTVRVAPLAESASVLLNGKPVAGTALVKAGDKLQIGPLKFQVELK